MTSQPNKVMPPVEKEAIAGPERPKEISDLQDVAIAQIDRLIAKGLLIKPLGHSPLDGYRGTVREVFSPTDYPEWKTQVEAFIVNFVGEHSVYNKNFRAYEEATVGRVAAVIGVLKAIKEDYQNGVVRGLRNVVIAEVILGLLEQGKAYLKEGRLDAAAILLGSVLENGLRAICQRRGIPVDAEDKLASLRDKLVTAGVFSPLQVKWLESAIRVRHFAVRREHDKFALADVEEMQKRVTDLLAFGL